MEGRSENHIGKRVEDKSPHREGMQVLAERKIEGKVKAASVDPKKEREIKLEASGGVDLNKEREGKIEAAGVDLMKERGKDKIYKC